MSTSTLPSAVLVHDAFVDASGIGRDPRVGQRWPHGLAPPNPLRGLAFDAAAIASYVTANVELRTGVVVRLLRATEESPSHNAI